MKTIDVIKTAIGNTFRSKLRTILTIIAIFIGAFTLTITSAVGNGISNYIDTQVNSLGAENLIIITKKQDNPPEDDKTPQKYNPEESNISSGQGPGSTLAINENDLKKLTQISSLTNIRPFVEVNVDYIQTTNSEKYKLTVNDIGSLTEANLASGTQLDNRSQENQIILPNKYLESLNLQNEKEALGQTVTLAVTDFLGNQETTQATIVGIQNNNLFGSSAALNQHLTDVVTNISNTGKPDTIATVYSSATALFDTTFSKEQINTLKTELENLGFNGTTISDQLGEIQTVLNLAIGVLNGFAIIALIAAGFGIINTLLMSVQERTREIGLMKAMGMSSKKVFSLFSFEAIFIGFLGSSIGALIAIILGTTLNKILSNGAFQNLEGFNIMEFAPSSVTFIILLVMLIAFLAGTLPARRAAKQNPIDALRYE